MLNIAASQVRFITGISYEMQAVHGVGLSLAALLAGTCILRAAVILHNKKIIRDPGQIEIAVPGWSYAALVMLLATLADVALIAVIVLITGRWRPEWLLVLLALRLPMHTGVLAWLLAASYRSAMVVQIFEIAIAMTIAPVAAAVLAILYVV